MARRLQRRSTPLDGRYRFATVGTDKRERQRANKAVKEQKAARAETRQKGTRIGVIIVGAIVGVIKLLNAEAGKVDNCETDPFECSDVNTLLSQIDQLAASAA